MFPQRQWNSTILPTPQPRLFCFGLGYSATRLARSLIADGWAVGGTCRSADAVDQLRDHGIDAHLFDGETAMAQIDAALAGTTHLLNSIPPGDDGDPVLALHGADLIAVAGLQWAGYFSTTGVYGDTDGDWVDETSLVAPSGIRAQRRVDTERAWFGLWDGGDAAAHIFRLAGIYGPGRSALDAARRGAGHRIIKSGHVFSRIHVDDIAAVLRASMAQPNPGAVYNVCDDAPAASADVTAFACDLLGIAPPPEIAFDDADLSPMARSFYADNRRVRNTRINDELGVTLAHPDYKSGLRAILAAEG